MMDKLKALYQRHGSVLRYVVIGGMTTVVNLAVFALTNGLLGIHYQVANILAWIFAVAFAFWGNKVVVFHSRTSGAKAMLLEAVRFVGTRFSTLAISALILYIAVDLLRWNANVSKLLSQVFEIVLNYVLGRLLVFRRKKEA